jgi:hypothetical protein
MTDALLCAGVFAFTFVYRFNTLGGALGGFSNDEFGYLARARQIEAGEVPFRDFNDPGWFLTDALSALAQSVGGYNLQSQAILTIGMLSLAAAMTFLLARRVSGSYAAAIVAILVHVGLEPRHYNYPKLMLYAAGVWLAWRYADRPTTSRAVMFGVWAGLGFLFRHDHIIYLGVLGLATIVMVHWGSPRTIVRNAGMVAGGASICLVPFLVFLSVSGGIGEYFRSAFVYVQRDAERTSFTLPRLSLDFSQPVVAIGRDPVDAESRVNVRWLPIPDEQRREREQQYRLADAMPAGESTWAYTLRDRSPENIEALVRDPAVDDTHGIERGSFAVTTAERPLRVQSQVETTENATAFLYYAFLALPVLAAGVLAIAVRKDLSLRVMTSASRLVPLIALAMMLNVGFLSRGTTNVRLPDVGVAVAVLLAWLCAAILTRDGRALVPRLLPRLAVRTAGVLVLLLTLLSVNTLGQSSRHLVESGLLPGDPDVVGRMREVSGVLGAHPSTFSQTDEQPAVLRVAEYIRRCTAQTDRLFVLAEHPELYYFADRLIAGGHAWLLPFYYSDDADEARIVSRLQDVRVPVVVTEDRGTYDNEYRMVFEQVDAYLNAFYADAGEVDAGDRGVLRVLVRKDLTSTGQYAPLGLPCFSRSRSVATR